MDNYRSIKSVNDQNGRHNFQPPESADVLLASELNDMTVADRTRVFEEIHGVAQSPPEESSLELREKSLVLLSEALDDIKDKLAYDEAQRMATEEGSTTFVNDEAFRLRFLRAEQFRPKQAAERMIRNLDLLYRYVGPEGLKRPIRLSDLDKSSLSLLKAGSFQLLPCRDRSGRRIVVRIGPLGLDFNKNEKSLMKTLLYMFHCLSEDVESQKRGVVVISFPSVNFDPSTITGPKAKYLIAETLQSIGVRITANHLCFPDKPWFRALGALFMMASTPSVRVRTRMHYGSVTECQYKIMSYGIPSDQLPIKSSGVIKIQNQKRWIAFRETKDQVDQDDGGGSFEGTFCPSSNDVLAIGGMHFYKFPGNCRYRELLESHLEEYDNANCVQDKIRITNEILSYIESSGGRFLVRDKQGWWIPANDETSRIKVSNAFRDVRKSLRAREKRKHFGTNFVFDR